jgi:hypothetical protein
MAFPESLNHVGCIGFPETMRNAIVQAVESKEVEWLEDFTYVIGESASGRFRYAGCIWELYEIFEVVHSITLIEGTPNAEFLTFAVLRG